MSFVLFVITLHKLVDIVQIEKSLQFKTIFLSFWAKTELR